MFQLNNEQINKLGGKAYIRNVKQANKKQPSEKYVTLKATCIIIYQVLINFFLCLHLSAHYLI